MARPRRPDFDGAYHHVMARGNHGENIFHQDVDFADFLSYLSKVCERHGWRVYGYCLMNNHYHLLVHTPHGKLSKGMGELNSYHTRRMNWRYETRGHIFQGRFKSLLIENDSYLLEVIRYIAMNPVDAGLVDAPQDWQWSSYRVQLAGRPQPSRLPWLEVHSVLSMTSSPRVGSRKSFQDFVEARDRIARASKRRLAELIEGEGGFGSPKFEGSSRLPLAKKRAVRNEKIRRDFQSGMTQIEIAERWQLNQSTVQRVLKSPKT